MSEAKKQDALLDALRMLDGLQCLMAETGEKSEVPIDGIYALLSCVVERLRFAAS